MTIHNIQMTDAGVELVIAALRKLPHEQVHELIVEIWAQYQGQKPAAQEIAAEPDAD